MIPKTAIFFGMLSALGCLTGCEQTTQSPTSPDYSIAITNVTVIDAVNGTRDDMTVLLNGDEIVSVEPGASVVSSAPSARLVIDGAGRYLIPGLWDMHAHITYEPTLTASMPNLFLDYGITSVRDTGGMLPKLLPEIEKWRAAGAHAPRVFFSGPLLDGTKVVYDGDDRPEIGISNATAELAVENIDALVSAGVDFIKIYELVSPQVFATLVAQARKHELPIAAHVPLALLADVAGPEVGSMEHLRNVELACANDADALLAERSKVLAESGERSGYVLRSALHAEFRPRALANIDVSSERCVQVINSLRHTIQVPTLRLNTITQYSPLERADWQSNLAKLPPALAQQWRQTAENFFGKASADSLKMASWSLQLVGEMHRGDVPIGAGTDTPIGQAIPGYSLHTELERLVEAGLSPIEAIRSATIRPAEFFGIQATHGQIQAGHVADMVLLSADPTLDIRNTRSIVSVISKGQVVR